MKQIVLILVFQLFTVVALSVGLKNGSYYCDNDSRLVIKNLKAQLHDNPDNQEEVSEVSILNSGRSVKLKFENGSTIICTRNKNELLFL